MLVSVILAGGIGKRLWPLSTSSVPKQFLKIIDGKSLFQHAIDNAQIISGNKIIILCNQENYNLVKTQLINYDSSNIYVLLEKNYNNSYLAIITACLYAKQKFCNSYLHIMPADHYIKNIEILSKEILKLHFLMSNNINIFGVKPNSVETAYGYIKKSLLCFYKANLYEVEYFTEKPSYKQATEYLKCDKYIWNTGMIFSSPDILIKEAEKYSKEIIKYAGEILDNSHYTDMNCLSLGEIEIKEEYKISIDYGLLEKTEKLLVSELDLDWQDLGSWNNIIQVKTTQYGDINIRNCYNSYFYAQNKKIIAIGIEDSIVIETDEAILVAAKDQIEDMSNHISSLNSSIKQDTKPWGKYEILTKKDNFQVKILKIDPGRRISLQSHRFRNESWSIISGCGRLILDDQNIILNTGDQVKIEKLQKHRIENIGSNILEILELQTGSYICETDITRFEDDYDRL